MTRHYHSGLLLGVSSLLIASSAAARVPSSDTPNETAADGSQGASGLTDCSGVTFSISDASAPAGSQLEFTITKSDSTTSSCSLRYATADGTAKSFSDYVPTSGSISFSPTVASQILRVQTMLGGPAGFSEHLFLNLSNPIGGATISDAQGFGEITH